jgi:hypothetical protein
VGCARCHDHKYDPISQKEYFRLQAFFAALQPRELPAATTEQQQEHARRLAAWEEATRDVRAEMEKLVGDKRAQMFDGALNKFRREIQDACRTPPEKRTPYQWQIALMAGKQQEQAARAAPTRLPAAAKKRYVELEKQLARFDHLKPSPLPIAMAVTDVGPLAPPTHRLMGGDWRKPAAEVQPGFLAALGGGAIDSSLPAGVASTGRRAALARWLTRPDHPLTARVMVNRLWQHHFGVGIVATSNDFGAQGTPPTHPNLLDWLAVEMVESGWDLKHLHRLMVLSAAYRQDSALGPAHARALKVDRDNALLWHARRRRLEGEGLRDATLALAGELSRRMFGPSARPRLPANISKYAWKPDEKPEERHRRSVYVLVKRNLRYPLFDAFDWPDLHNSCARRLPTTTAPQALLLLNGDFTLARARAWADRLRGQFVADERLLAAAYRAAWGRPATPGEVRLGLDFLSRQAEVHRAAGVSPGLCRDEATVDFCHALLNTNEFLYVD